MIFTIKSVHYAMPPNILKQKQGYEIISKIAKRIISDEKNQPPLQKNYNAERKAPEGNFFLL